MRIPVSTAAIVLLACSSSMQSADPAADITLTAAPATLAAGDTVILTLENDALEQIGFNLCASSLERQTADAWEPVQTDVVCTMELRTLETGAKADYRAALPAVLSPGRYRYTTSVEAMEAGSRHAVSSTIFTVTP